MNWSLYGTNISAQRKRVHWILNPQWFEIAGDTCSYTDINGSTCTLNKSQVIA